MKIGGSENTSLCRFTHTPKSSILSPVHVRLFRKKNLFWLQAIYIYWMWLHPGNRSEVDTGVNLSISHYILKGVIGMSNRGQTNEIQTILDLLIDELVNLNSENGFC